MDSIFTKIIKKEIPAYLIDENEYNIAFLDINPIAKGHTLVVPKKQIDNIFDLPNKNFTEAHLFAKKIAHAIQKTIKCNRVGIAVIGLEVPHAHIHLVPINKIEDMNFQKEKFIIDKNSMISIAQEIKSNIEN